MAKAWTRISVQKKTNRSKNRGFSLIEIMIVLAIIGVIATFGSKAFINKNTRVKSSVRRFAVMIKKLRNRARIENRTYRLVFDLPASEKDPQSYWVESSGQEVLLMNEEELEERKKELMDKQGNKEVDPYGFTPAGGFGTDGDSGKQLPIGLYFDSIEVDGLDSPQKTGRIYIFFFPQGYVQESAIHITDRNDLNWTLAINPLTGKVDIIPRFARLEELMADEK